MVKRTTTRAKLKRRSIITQLVNFVGNLRRSYIILECLLSRLKVIMIPGLLYFPRISVYINNPATRFNLARHQFKEIIEERILISRQMNAYNLDKGCLTYAIL